MTGFGLFLLTILALLGGLGFLWVGSVYDAWRIHRYQLDHRNRWLSGWHTYTHNNPQAKVARYTRDHPTAPPPYRQRSLEKLWFSAAAGCYILEVILAWKSFQRWHHAVKPMSTVASLYPWFALIVTVIWLVALWEETVLPVWARSDVRRRERLPALPRD